MNLDKIEKLEKQLAKKFGQNSMFDIEKAEEVFHCDRIPTGNLALDWQIGGGWPRKNISCVFGEYSTGKSSLMKTTVGECVKNGLACYYLDLEQATCPEFDEGLHPMLKGLSEKKGSGIKWSCGAGSMERNIDLINTAIQAGVFDIVIIDSAQGHLPANLYDGPEKVGDGEKMMSNVRQPNALMAQWSRILKPLAFANNCAVVFTSMYGEKTVMAGGQSYTKPNVPGYSHKMWHMTALVSRLRILNRGEGTVTNSKGMVVDPLTGDKVNGQLVNSEIFKCRVPYSGIRNTEFLFKARGGWCNEKALVDVGAEIGVVTGRYSWVDGNGEVHKGAKKIDLVEAIARAGVMNEFEKVVVEEMSKRVANPDSYLAAGTTEEDEIQMFDEE